MPPSNEAPAAMHQGIPQPTSVPAQTEEMEGMESVEGGCIIVEEPYRDAEGYRIVEEPP